MFAAMLVSGMFSMLSIARESRDERIRGDGAADGRPLPHSEADGPSPRHASASKEKREHPMSPVEVRFNIFDVTDVKSAKDTCVLKVCADCGAMRKTTGGKCVACFLLGPGTGSPRSKDERFELASPSLPPIENHSAMPRPRVLRRSLTEFSSSGSGPSPSSSSTLAMRMQSKHAATSTSSQGLLPLEQQALLRPHDDCALSRSSLSRGSFAAAAAQGLTEDRRTRRQVQDKRHVDCRGPSSYRGAEARALAKDESRKSPRVRTNAEASDRVAGLGVALGIRRQTSEDLPGGFRRGEKIVSLVSRTRLGEKLLELGHEGVVVGLSPAAELGKKDGQDLRLLIQFRLGFDWLLSAHQVCPAAQLQARTSAGLPGGFKWGDQVQSLVTKLLPANVKRGLALGDTGTVVGPGAIEGKLAIRFDGCDWSLWPAAVCKQEAFAMAFAAKLAGGFRRGDKVHAKAQKAGYGGPSKPALEDGQEGTVIGPGHSSGRVLVRFGKDGSSWSLDPSAIALASAGG